MTQIFTPAVGNESINGGKDQGSPSKVISDEVHGYLAVGLYFCLASGVSVLGTLTNMVNIAVFARQGLQRLYLSDDHVCGGPRLATMLGGLCRTLNLALPDHTVDLYDIFIVFAVGPRIYFATLSMCTTVVLAVERCLCVIRPLTFKRVINKKTTTFCLVLLYVEVCSVGTALFAMQRLAWKFDPLTNSSRLVLDIQPGPVSLDIVLHHNVNNIVLTTVSVSVVLVTTIVMVATLRSIGQFRQKSVTSSRDSSMSTREFRLVKLVTLISLIFLVCYLPATAVIILRLIIPEIDAYGFYSNLSDTLWGLVWFLGACNSSVNIFVYYQTSSKYKETYTKLRLSLNLHMHSSSVLSSQQGVNMIKIQ